LKVSEQVVYKYLKGEHTPRPDKVQKIADLLGVTVASLHSDSDEIKEADKEVIVTDSKYIKTLEELVQSLKEQLADCRDRIK